MKFVIRHEIKGRIRVHLMHKPFTCREAELMQYYLECLEYVKSARVNERIMDVVIRYGGSRDVVIGQLKKLRDSDLLNQEGCPEQSGRELNTVYWEKLATMITLRIGNKLFLPCPLQAGIAAVKSVAYIWKGIKTLIKGKLEVPVLDATAIGVSVIRRDFNTASSIMFLLGIGELLEEWTHKKSVDDLARSMALNIEKVWLRTDGQEILVPVTKIRPGDFIIVRTGMMIPFDGNVSEGEGMVNQAALTGEPLPVHKTAGSYVYAGTAVEEGNLVIQADQAGGISRYEKIVAMIEESEKLKSSLEGKAEHLADRLVSYTLAGTGLTYLLTRNTTKALAILMVDFSCALKLAMPISVLSAIREASQYQITVKGGRYLEAAAEAETVVFDKTGTLTLAEPAVASVVSFNGASEDELLRIAACMEEHFPHSMARAVVEGAKMRNLTHEELHSEVEYVVAHGISTWIDGKKAVIGSYHFVFEDEKCRIPEGKQELFDCLPEEYSHLYLAIEQKLAAVICIRDPLRKEAAQVIRGLKEAGIKKVVMMTGDSERTARAIARMVGVDEYYSEVLPEDKAGFIQREKQAGRKVLMIGDGINDSPALSAADVGIAIRDGAAIAKEIADITIDAKNLSELVTLKKISNLLMKRIHRNYRLIVGINAGLIGLGVGGVLAPATSALLHNTSTLAISLSSMKNLLPLREEEDEQEAFDRNRERANCR